MTRSRLVGVLLPLLLLLPSSSAPATVLACSCLQQTVNDLPADAIVIIGRVGERSGGARPLAVERWFNGPGMTDVLVIAFQEGEPIGDCSYPVATGERKFIVPDREGAMLISHLCTMQAPVDTDYGRELIAAATAHYGPGVVPEATVASPSLSESPEDAGPLVAVAVALAIVVAALFGGLVILARRGRRPPA